MSDIRKWALGLRRLWSIGKEDSRTGIAGVQIALGMSSGEVEILISDILKIQGSEH